MKGNETLQHFLIFASALLKQKQKPFHQTCQPKMKKFIKERKGRAH
jgi:hypothetical protein